MKPDLNITRRFLSFLMSPRLGCMEFRVFHATYDRGGFVVPASQYSRTYAGWYDDPGKLAVDAGRLKGISGYVTLNPVTPILLSRADNRLIHAKHTTTDADIVALRWLYIDIDPVRPADVSATDDERLAALARRDAILADHPTIARSSLYGCSGNGGFIMVRLPDLPSNAEHREAIARAVKTLSVTYTDPIVKVDATTKNPSRVACLPGTVKAKGSNRPERPWRLVTWENDPEILAFAKASA